MDPITAAVHDMLTTNAADLRAAVTGLDVEALNWTPAPDTSSIAVLVAHAVSATRVLVDSALTGRMHRERYMTEDRPAAFATRDVEEATLHSLLDGLEQTISRLAAEAPSDGYAGNVEFERGYEGGPRSRIWSLIHAVEHLREHVGHAQLTRQLIEARRS